MSIFDDFDEESMRTMRGDTTEGTLGRIDQYDIVRKLGGGGFGVVYLVRDTLSNVEYAIKTLHPLLKSNPEEMENLKSQFSLVSKLSHPNIASAMYLHPIREVVYATEEVRKELRLSAGDFVMVMKYAPGVTLSKWRKQFSNGIVPVDKAIDICKQVASALDYAHSEKIIHRDIKPGNIMIETRENGLAIARVLDFDLAAEIRSSMSRVSTDKGDTSGTRPYMAPEQWMGKKQGSATDQYALAVLFYELVSGSVPFAGVFETGDIVIMINAVENRHPEALEELSEEQNQVLLKALSKSPKDRYDSCSTFLDVMLGKVTVQPQVNILSSNSNTKSIICKKCNCENEVDSTFCVGCGAKIERDDICPKCGATLSENQMFCKKCGSKTPLCLAKEAEQKVKEEAVRKARIRLLNVLMAEAASKAREEAERKTFEEIGKTLNVGGIDIVRIPDSVEHRGLYFGKYPVTQGQWQEIMGNNPSYFKGDTSNPVESVSWNDCQKFIEKLNTRSEVMSVGITFRLPTTEEWEYACRAGSTGEFGLLADGREGTLDEMGWYADNSGEKTHPVGQKTPNAWGLYDMHGNVWEWIASDYGDERLCLGGSWFDKAEDIELRNYDSSDSMYSNFGFRLVAFRTEKTFEQTKELAEQGDADAQCNLGLCYYNGQGVEQDYAEAVKWYRKAAEQGEAVAQNNLGYCYENGQGVPQDYDEAVKWYRKAAEQGEAVAQNNIGACYEYGRGVSQDYAEAEKWFRKAADQGDADAQYNLGNSYYNGQGVEQDYAEAVNWYRKAAEQGYAVAQCNLGVCYENGQGVEQDYAEAVKWYRKASEQGDADAQYNLGNSYYNSQGVEQDYAEAVNWYRKAADQGDAFAQFILGVCYAEGKGVPRDDAEAEKWFLKAAEQGNEDALNVVKLLS